MDFTLAKTPFVAVGLTLLMFGLFSLACALSHLKWRLLLGRNPPLDPHRVSAAATIEVAPDSSFAAPPLHLDGAGLSTPYVPFIAPTQRNPHT